MTETRALDMSCEPATVTNAIRTREAPSMDGSPLSRRRALHLLGIGAGAVTLTASRLTSSEQRGAGRGTSARIIARFSAT